MAKSRPQIDQLDSTIRQNECLPYNKYHRYEKFLIVVCVHFGNILE